MDFFIALIFGGPLLFGWIAIFYGLFRGAWMSEEKVNKYLNGGLCLAAIAENTGRGRGAHHCVRHCVRQIPGAVLPAARNSYFSAAVCVLRNTVPG